MNLKGRNWLRYGAVGVAILALAGLLLAQDDQQGPQRRAVRLSSVDGQVELSQGGTVITDHALANLPIFEGTRLVTGDDGRVELQFDNGSIARIPPDSSLTLTKLDPNGETTVVLDSGMGYFELQSTSGQPPMQVRFDNTVVTANESTIMRVKLDQPPGQVAVFQGDANLNEGDGAAQVEVHGGESVTLNANDPSQYVLAENIDQDSWDQWNSDRDQALAAEESDQNPATENAPDKNNPAWADLNQNGTWYDTGDQGYVWSPYAASDPGWDPYGDGYWVDEPIYGYVWVSSYPWGYLPYQCGAWSYYSDFGWGWAPGMCHPWWFYGGGWGGNIGYAPPWYHRPVRPGPPRRHEPRTLEAGNSGGRPPIGIRPIIAVNRRMPPTNKPLPPRDRATPVELGGRVFRPLPPVSTRVRSNPPNVTFRPQPAPVAPVNRRPVYTPPANTYRPTQQWPAARPGYTPPTQVYPRPTEPPRNAPAPVYRPPVNNGGERPAPPPRYTPPPAPRYSPPPAPRASPPPAPRSSPPPAPRSSPPPAPRSSPSAHSFWHPSSWFTPHSSQGAASSHARSWRSSGSSSWHSSSRSSGHSSSRSGGGGSRGGGSHGGGSHGGGGHSGGGSHGGGGRR